MKKHINLKSKNQVNELRVEVLVTTMNKSISDMVLLAKKMKINSDAIIRSQSSALDPIDKTIENGIYKLRLVISNDRGLSLNRNSLLDLSSADLIIFADDDEIFMDNYKDKILSDFSSPNTPDCIEYSVSRDYAKSIHFKDGNNTFLKSSSFGVWAVVIKRSVLLNKKIRFDNRIGSGAPIYCGEDSVFKKDLFKNKVIFFTSSFVLVHNENRKVSSWYTGDDERVFLSRSIIYGMCHRYSYILYLIRMLFLKGGKNYTTLKKSIEAAKIGITMRKYPEKQFFWNNNKYEEK